MSYFKNTYLHKLQEINGTQIKLANHWLKIKSLHEQHKYIKNLADRVESDRRRLETEAATKIQNWWRRLLSRQQRMHKENLPESSNDRNIYRSPIAVMVCKRALSAAKIQAWWRGVFYRRHSMLQEHKEKLVHCVKEIREAPCSEANPRDERQIPLNQRIERYLDGLLSSVLTERKAMTIRLNRLATRSHVCIECMLSRGALAVVVESLEDLNRSEAHLYVLRPLSDLIVKLLSYKPFVEQYVPPHIDGLVSKSIKLIHNNHKDKEVVASLVEVLRLLSSYADFRDKIEAAHFSWYMNKFQQLFGCIKAADDPRHLAYKKLCKLRREKRTK